MTDEKVENVGMMYIFGFTARFITDSFHEF